MDQRAIIPPGLPRSRELNSPNRPTVSYWQDPPDNIADLRTTEVLPTSAEYVVVGSGISGSCIAYNILHRIPHSRVTMLEAREACSGATGRNGQYLLTCMIQLPLCIIMDQVSVSRCASFFSSPREPSEGAFHFRHISSTEMVQVNLATTSRSIEFMNC